MPTKTTVTVQSPARPSAAKPRVTVSSRDTRSSKRSSPVAASPRTRDDPRQENQPATASATATDRNPRPKEWMLPVGAIGILILIALLYFSWKSVTGVSGESIAARIERSVADEHKKDRKAASETKSELSKGLSSLERKLDESIQANDKDRKEFATKATELEKGMVALVDGMKEIGGQVAKDLAASRKDDEEFRKKTSEKVESIATRIEERLKGLEPKDPAPKDRPEDRFAGHSSYRNDSSDTRMVVAPGKSEPARFDAWELRPGDMSVRFCREDIQAGKVEISKKPGIVARNHLSAWKSTWIDVPVPPDGNYTPSPQAKYVSFYSPTETFIVKKLRM